MQIFFVKNVVHCGIGFNRQSCFVRRRQSIMDKVEGSFREVRLKLVNNRNEAVFYTDCHDGRGYIKSVRGVDISGFNHNNFGGFLGIRIALAGLKGGVCFRDFEYQPVISDIVALPMLFSFYYSQ